MTTTAVDIVVKVAGGQKLDRLNRSLKGLDASASKTATSSKKAEVGIRKAGNAAGGASKQFNKLKGALAGLGLAAVAKQVIGNAANFEQLQLRLKVLSQEFGEFDRVQKLVQTSAKQFGQSQTEAAQGISDVYARLRPLGIELGDIEKVYKGFNATAIASGTSTEAASAAFLQLSQALGSGRLQGDEFRSIAEQVPGILRLVAEELGVTVGELKKLGSEGKITSDVLINALARGFDVNKGKIDQILANSPAQKFKDFSNAVSDLSNAIGSELLPEIIPLVKAATDLVRGIAALPDPIKRVIGVLITLAAKLFLVNKTIKGMIALRAGIVGMLGATAGGLTAAGKAASVANPKLLLAKNTLLALGKIGIITIGVDIIINGLQKLAEVEARFKKIAGSTSNDFASSVGGSALSKSEIDKLIQENRAEFDRRKKELESIKFPALTAQDEIAKAALLQLDIRLARLQTLKERARFATPADREAADAKRNGNLTRNTETGGGSSGSSSSTKSETVDQTVAIRQELERTLALDKQLNSFDQQLLRNKFELEDAIARINTEAAAGNRAELTALAQKVKGQRDFLTLLEAAKDFGTSAGKELADKLPEKKKELSEAEQLLKDAGKSVGSAIQQSIGAAIDAAINGADDLGDRLKKIASSLLSSIGNKLIGAAISSIPGFASGGSVAAGSVSLVGERGPELFVSNTAGQVSNQEQFNAARQAMKSSSSVQSSAAAEQLETERYESMMLSNNQPIAIRLDEVVINEQRFTTPEETQRAVAAGVKEARARVFADLRNKPATRSQLGM